MKNWITIVLCIFLLVTPQFIAVAENNEPKIFQEIRQFTIFEMTENKNSVSVLDGFIDNISKVDTEVIKPFTIKLIDSQKGSDFEVGWHVEAICHYTQPTKDESIKYFDCDLALITDIQTDFEIIGTLYSINIKSNLFVISVGEKFYRVEFSEDTNTDKLYLGDYIKINGISSLNRPFLIKSASFKILEDTENKRLLLPCEMSTGNWFDGLFRVKTRNEYWQVNFLEEQPNEHLKYYMQFGVKGTRDNHLEQTLHKCILLDIIEKRVLTGKIINMLPGHGLVQIMDTSEFPRWIKLEMTYDEISEFNTGDNIRIDGYEIPTRYDLPVLFSTMVSIESNEVHPVFFNAEVEECSACQEDRMITILSGNKRWYIDVPEDFDCSDIDFSDWVYITGSIQSFRGKMIKANSLKKSKVVFLGKIIASDHTKSELLISGIQGLKTWSVFPNSSGRNNFKRGELLQVKGDLDHNKALQIKNASLKKLKTTRGQIVSIDAYSYNLTINNIVGRKMIIDIRPDWYNINSYSTGEWIEVTGVRSKNGLKDTLIRIIQKE